MIISVLKDYKIFDAGSKKGVQEIIKRLSITSSNVTLNLSRCIIDYPATSVIIDKILLELIKRKQPGVLIIQTHLNILEALLLHWLFIGSHFFQIDASKKKISLQDFRSFLTTKLTSEKLKLQIQITDKEGKTLKEFKYGQD